MSVTAYRSAYHHGDLHSALLAAARGLLKEQGLAGLTLRATARVAGVSHAAPQHHFGDLSGMLSELAAVGFHELADCLEASKVGVPAAVQLHALGFAYATFAAEQPAMFLLMFRGERLDHERPALSAATKRARELLGSAALVPALAGEGDPPQRTPRGQVLRAWSIVHGFSMLHLDGRLDRLLNEMPGRDWRDLLSEVLSFDVPK